MMEILVTLKQGEVLRLLRRYPQRYQVPWDYPMQYESLSPKDTVPFARGLGGWGENASGDSLVEKWTVPTLQLLTVCLDIKSDN